jgi:hypothetical protein
MAVLLIIATTAFLLLVLFFVVYGLSTLFGHHPQTGERRAESPHLEARDEYELTHDTGSPHLESWAEYKRRHGVPA